MCNGMEIKQIREYEEIKNEIVKLKETFGALFERVNFEDYVKKLSQYAAVYVLKEDTTTCGLAAIYMNDKENKVAYITLIGIAREYRRTNLGTLLIRHCVEKAKDCGMKTLKLEVDQENYGAIAFYEREGLQIIKEGSDKSFYMAKTIL